MLSAKEESQQKLNNLNIKWMLAIVGSLIIIFWNWLVAWTFSQTICFSIWTDLRAGLPWDACARALRSKQIWLVATPIKKICLIVKFERDIVEIQSGARGSGLLLRICKVYGECNNTCWAHSGANLHKRQVRPTVMPNCIMWSRVRSLFFRAIRNMKELLGIWRECQTIDSQCGPVLRSLIVFQIVEIATFPCVE